MAPPSIKQLAEQAGFDYEERAYNLNVFAQLIIDYSVNFFHSCDYDFEAEQLEEFWG
jgi:hypothetical protein